jgi:hypothetical protein
MNGGKKQTMYETTCNYLFGGAENETKRNETKRNKETRLKTSAFMHI